MFNKKIDNNKQVDIVFKNPQFKEIIQAIIQGKYSWACILFLRFSGYDPREYIPYEIYNQLVKENSVADETHQNYNHEHLEKNTVIRIY